MLEAADCPEEQNLKTRMEVHARYTRGTKKYWRVFVPLKEFMASSLNQPVRPNCGQGDWKQDIREAMAENRRLIESALDGALTLRPLLEQARNALKDLITAENSSEGEERERPDHLAIGRALTGLGRLKEAWLHYRAALAGRPEDNDLMLEAARVCIQRERLRAARELVKNVMENDPDHPDAPTALEAIEQKMNDWLTRVDTLIDGRDWVGALLTARKILGCDPENERARQVEEECGMIKSLRISEGNRLARAARRRKTSRQLTEQAAEACNLGNFQEAVDLLDGRLDAEHPEDLEGLVLLGSALAELGRLDEGQIHLQAVLAKRPDWPLVRARLAGILIGQGETVRGLEMLENVGRGGNGFKNLLFEAGCLSMKLGDFDRAIRDFEDHLSLAAGSHETMNKLAICHLAKGRPKSARHYFEKVMLQNPESETARQGLEKCLALEPLEIPEKGGR